MSRHRDKRAAFVLAVLLVVVFVFGQARRADADRQAGAAGTPSGDLVTGSASATLHD